MLSLGKLMNKTGGFTYLQLLQGGGCLVVMEAPVARAHPPVLQVTADFAVRGS